MTKEGILKYSEQNKFVLFCGIELHEDTDGDYYTTIDVKEHHHNIVVFFL